jgi:hypothetical protein
LAASLVEDRAGALQSTRPHDMEGASTGIGIFTLRPVCEDLARGLTFSRNGTKLFSAVGSLERNTSRSGSKAAGHLSSPTPPLADMEHPLIQELNSYSGFSVRDLGHGAPSQSSFPSRQAL